MAQSKKQIPKNKRDAQAIQARRLPQAALVRHWINSHVPTDQIHEMTVLATQVMEDKDKAVTWLRRPNIATDNRPPVDLLGEKQGYDRVRSLLLRIEHGVLA